MPKQSYLQKALSTLGALNQSELRDLRRAIDDLLELLESPDDDQDQTSDDDSDVRRPALGHIEAKRIRGYGPYLYLRRWEGKTLTSTYIGKARS